MGCGPSKHRGRSSFRDRYDLGPKVGTGAFAQVRLCTCKSTGSVRVVKLISKPYSKADFELEVELLKEVGLGGPCSNVVQFFGHYEDLYYFYSVMEYCSGGELLDHVGARESITESLLSNWMSQILSAIAHIHNLGIVHRDIKPQNLLFQDDTHETVKLIDFGLSYKVPPRQLLDEPCGTPEFVAPEMILGRYGRKIDVWSVGILCYLLLFGRCPFSAPTERELFRDIVEKEPNWTPIRGASYTPSFAAVDFCRSLLCKNFKTRPTAAQAMKHIWITQKGQVAHEPSRVVSEDIRRRARMVSLQLGMDRFGSLEDSTSRAANPPQLSARGSYFRCDPRTIVADPPMLPSTAESPTMAADTPPKECKSTKADSNAGLKAKQRSLSFEVNESMDNYTERRQIGSNHRFKDTKPPSLTKTGKDVSGKRQISGHSVRATFGNLSKRVSAMHTGDTFRITSRVRPDELESKNSLNGSMPSTNTDKQQTRVNVEQYRNFFVDVCHLRESRDLGAFGSILTTTLREPASGGGESESAGEKSDEEANAGYPEKPKLIGDKAEGGHGSSRRPKMKSKRSGSA